MNAQDTNVDWGTASDDQVILQAIEQTTPVPSNDVPSFATFYSAQHSPISAEPWPPLPVDVAFDAWDMGSNVWLLDDLAFDYNAPSTQVNRPMMAMDESGFLPPGSSDTNTPAPAGSPVPFDPGTNLWIAQEVVSNGAFGGILSNTIPGVEYQLLSMNSLDSTQWVYDGGVILATTNWAPWSVPYDPTTNFFLNALSFQDSTGSGIPDWWWLKYFGQDTNVDPYADPVGDGWTLLQDFQNGWDPTNWNTPPAPEGLTINDFDSVSGTATLSWLPSPGAVTNYTVQTPSGYVNLSPEVTRYIDLNSFLGATYMVQADYFGGPSAWSAQVSTGGDPAPNAAIVPGPEGNLYLVASGLPSDLAAIQITRNSWASGFYSFFEFPQSSVYLEQDLLPSDPLGSSGTFEIPATDITNGICEIPPTQVTPFYPYQFSIQAIRSNGVSSTASVSGVSGGTPTLSEALFIDGRSDLKDNLRFLFRAASDIAPFEFYSASFGADFTWPSNHICMAFYDNGEFINGNSGPDTTPDPLAPLNDNIFYKNFVFDANDMTNISGTATVNTGIFYGDYGNLAFNSGEISAPGFEYFLNVNAFIANPVVPVSALSSNDTVYISPPTSDGVDNFETNFPSVGDKNIYGLRFTSAEGAWYQTNVFYDETFYPEQGNLNGWPYPDAEQPGFQAVDYYFCRPGIDPMPEDADFTGTNTTPLVIVPVDRQQPLYGDFWTQLAGYARLAVTNGNPGVYGYIGQYFTNAYQITGNGQTTNSAGIISPYGQFFATQPGPAALVTMPDPDTGRQGTCTVYCVSLQVDKNHDGVMDTSFNGADATSQASPMEFWINDDNDGTGTGQEINAPESPDSASDVIQSMRDLEDFARLWICGMPSVDSASGYNVTLGWANITSGNPSIKIFPSQETNGGTAYLTDTNVAQYYVGNPLTEPCFGTVSNYATFSFPNEYFFPAGTKYLIFEGVTAGAGELMLTINDNNGNTIAQTGVWLDLHDVRDLYEREIITNSLSGAVSNWSSGIELVQHQVVSSPGEDTNIIVYVHGGANTDFNWLSRSDTVFKRLYWAGYRGRLATVRWPSPTEGQIAEYGTGWFNRSELIAYKSASSLKEYLNQLHSQFPGDQISLFPQSLGGAVVSEALYEGGSFDNLILCQVAMSASCYDINAPTNESLAASEQDNPTPDWQPMGYHGIYSSLVGNIVSYFNTNDNFMSLWLLDQESYKPGVGYSFDGTNSWYDDFDFFYAVADAEESRAMVARSRTLAIGNIGPGSGQTGQGIIGSAVDLHAQFGIGQSADEHSAFFTRPIQTILPLYFEILTDCNIQPSGLQ